MRRSTNNFWLYFHKWWKMKTFDLKFREKQTTARAFWHPYSREIFCKTCVVYSFLYQSVIWLAGRSPASQILWDRATSISVWIVWSVTEFMNQRINDGSERPIAFTWQFGQAPVILRPLETRIFRVNVSLRWELGAFEQLRWNLAVIQMVLRLWSGNGCILQIPLLVSVAAERNWVNCRSSEDNGCILHYVSSHTIRKRSIC
jgi:hypothetical protein